MNIQDKIKVLELKTVALGKAQRDQLRELEELKAKAANPAPPVRRNLKARRIQDVANFYLKRNI